MWDLRSLLTAAEAVPATRRLPTTSCVTDCVQAKKTLDTLLPGQPLELSVVSQLSKDGADVLKKVGAVLGQAGHHASSGGVTPLGNAIKVRLNEG